MDKITWLGFAKLGEIGQSGTFLVSGRNLRRKGRHTDPPVAGPDDPVFKEGLVISTPIVDRPRDEPLPEADKPGCDPE